MLNFHQQLSYQSNKVLWVGWIFIKKMNFHNLINVISFQKYGEFSSRWVKNTNKNDGFHWHDDFSSKRLIFVKRIIFLAALTFFLTYAFSSKWKLIHYLRIFCIKMFISMMNYYQNISLLWEFFMAMIDLNHRASFHHFDLF